MLFIFLFRSKPLNLQKKIFLFIAVGLIVVTASLAWTFSFGKIGLWRQQKMKNQVIRLEAEIDSLKTELEIRKHEEEQLLKDSFYIESIARKNYGLSKKGEISYQFTSEKE